MIFFLVSFLSLVFYIIIVEVNYTVIEIRSCAYNYIATSTMYIVIHANYN